MPGASAFDRHFSAEEQRNLAAWLDANPHVTVDQFRNMLADRGLTVARSTAGETKRRIERLGERLREGRRAMDAIAVTLEGQDDTQRSRALIEMARSLLFDFQSSALDSGVALDVGELQKLLRGVHDLMKAAQHNQLAGEAVRREIRAEVAEIAVAEARRQGLSAEGAAQMRAKIEGAA